MSRDRSEMGFTLVELLVATAISGIIIGAIAGILIVTLQSYPRSAATLSLSDNAQLLSSWLVPDVQSAGWSDAQASQAIDTNPLTPSTGCAGPVPASSNIVKLVWSDFNNPGVVFAAAYRQVGTEIIRYFCQGGTATPAVTTVGRNVATATAIHTGDSVDVDVKTSDLKSGSAYEFHVSASRRTPVLRVFAVPTIGSIDPTTVKGTATPSTWVTVSITDQAFEGVPPQGPVVRAYQSDVSGNWTSGPIDPSVLKVLNDGLITFTVNYRDGGTAKATTTAIKDSEPMNSRVSPITGSPTSDTTIKFLVSFNKPLGTGQCFGLDDVTVKATGATVVTTVTPSTCPASPEIWTVSVAITPTSSTGVSVSLTVNQNRVFDRLGVGNRLSNVPVVTYSASPTIVASGGNGTPVVLNGIASPPPAAPVTVSICSLSDRLCSTPLHTYRNIPVDTSGAWTYPVPSSDLVPGASYYATVSQGGPPPPPPVYTGPFTG